MQALILAAGLGKRLGSLTANKTKCRVEVNGVSLISRMLTQLRGKVSRTIIVTGYEADSLMEHIDSVKGDMEIIYVHNSDYAKTNNIFSLYLAGMHFMEDDTILLESDLIFDEEILNSAINAEGSAVAIVSKYKNWMDGTVVKLNESGKIMGFVSKNEFNESERSLYYKTVNIYKFKKEFIRDTYIPFLEVYTKVTKSDYYEQVLKIINSISSSKIDSVVIPDSLRWYEIDTQSDLEVASSLFGGYDKLVSRYGGFWRYPQMLDFCYLVNPTFPPKKLSDELTINFNELMRAYPSGQEANSYLAASMFDINPKWIRVGNGAAEIINVLPDILEGHVGVIIPSFNEYINRFKERGMHVHPFELTTPDYSFKVAELIEFIKREELSSFVLVNPDNPSSFSLSAPDVLSLIYETGKLGVTLVIDESFADFSDIGSLIDDGVLYRFPHLIVIKSISKSYGVPGLRLGVVCNSNPNIINMFGKRLSIWNINSIAEFFMQIFVKYKSDYKKSLEEFKAIRSEFVAGLNEIPYLRVLGNPSANYVMVECLNNLKSDQVCQKAYENQIILKDLYDKTGRQLIRIAVRSRNENDRLLDVLKS